MNIGMAILQPFAGVCSSLLNSGLYVLKLAIGVGFGSLGRIGDARQRLAKPVELTPGPVGFAALLGIAVNQGSARLIGHNHSHDLNRRAAVLVSLDGIPPGIDRDSVERALSQTALTAYLLRSPGAKK